MLVIITIIALFVIFPARPVLAAPLIQLTPRSGGPGTIVTVRGYNFDSYVGDALTVYMDSYMVSDAEATVDDDGNLEFEFTVSNYLMYGEKKVSIENRYGAELAAAYFTVTEPEIRLDMLGGNVASSVNANCRGFYAGDIVTIRCWVADKTVILGSSVANDIGEASLEFDIPSCTQGEHEVFATDEHGHRAEVQFMVVPEITLATEAAVVGDIVDISGTGFSAETELAVTLYGEVVAHTTTDEEGTFTAKFYVPVLKAGTYLVTIEAFEGDFLWSEITIVPRIELTVSEGEVGAQISIFGAGFDVEKSVTVYYDDKEVGRSVTDDSGYFEYVATVPQSSAGSHYFYVSDGTNVKQATYTVESDSPDAPELLFPKDREETYASFTINWESVYDISQPLSYTIEIARGRDFEDTVFEKDSLTLSQIDINDELLPNRPGSYYYWRVRAQDGAGNVGEWSEYAEFRIKPLHIMPSWLKAVLICIVVLMVAAYLVFLFRILRGLKSG